MDEAGHVQQVQIDDRTHVHCQWAFFIYLQALLYLSSSRSGYELLTLIYALYPLIKQLQVFILGATGTTSTASQPI